LSGRRASSPIGSVVAPAPCRFFRSCRCLRRCLCSGHLSVLFAVPALFARKAGLFAIASCGVRHVVRAPDGSTGRLPAALPSLPVTPSEGARRLRPASEGSLFGQPLHLNLPLPLISPLLLRPRPLFSGGHLRSCFLWSAARRPCPGRVYGTARRRFAFEFAVAFDFAVALVAPARVYGTARRRFLFVVAL
jgi:hypothetical protein